MMRILVSLAVLALLALGLGWLADQPGEVSVLWQGTRYHVPMAKAAVLLFAVVATLILVWWLLQTLLKIPMAARRSFRTKKRSRGFNAVTQGMIAVGSGDVRGAQHQAHEAEKILGAEPLALLLRAQAAQLAGDRVAAEAAFKAMLCEAETRPLGLRGLFVEARRRNDKDAARGFAAEAVRVSPALPWAGTALLEFQTADKDWDNALATLQRNADHRLIDRDTFKRHRAVLLTASALDKLERNKAQARANALEAVKLAPNLVPAVELAARILSEANEVRKAARLIEAAWRVNPHPALAEALMAVRPADWARDRLAKARALAAQVPGNPEDAIALARAALSAKEFTLARSALSPLLSGGATERVYLLMADIEEAEHGETGRLREWLSRAVRAPRDPAWIADGLISDVWLPFSPVSGRIDAFEWKLPIERLHGPGIDQAHDVLADVDEPPAQALPEKRESSAVSKPETPKRKLPAIVPIVATHPAPDDPGPDAEPGAGKRTTFIGG